MAYVQPPKLHVEAHPSFCGSVVYLVFDSLAYFIIKPWGAGHPLIYLAEIAAGRTGGPAAESSQSSSPSAQATTRGGFGIHATVSASIIALLYLEEDDGGLASSAEARAFYDATFSQGREREVVHYLVDNLRQQFRARGIRLFRAGPDARAKCLAARGGVAGLLDYCCIWKLACRPGRLRRCWQPPFLRRVTKDSRKGKKLVQTAQLSPTER